MSNTKRSVHVAHVATITNNQNKSDLPLDGYPAKPLALDLSRRQHGPLSTLTFHGHSGQLPTAMSPARFK